MHEKDFEDKVKLGEERIQKTNKPICLIYNIISLILFIYILYDVYGFDKWQSNLLWILLSVISVLEIVMIDYNRIFLSPSIICIFFSIVLSFCLMGNYCMVYPLDKNTGVINIIEFLIFSMACYPIVVMISCILQTDRFLGQFINTVSGEKKYGKKHFLVYLGIPIFVGIISMVALNPCIVSYDAFEVIAEAKGLTPVQDYAGVLYVLWFRLLLSIIDKAWFLCSVQIIIFSVVAALFLIYIEQKFNLKHTLMIFVWTLFLLLPGNIMMLITLSKDVYYCIFLLLLTYSMVRIYHEPEKKVNYVLMGVACLLVWSIRQSGMLSVFVVFILGLLLCNKKGVFLLTMVCSIMAAIVFNTGLIKVVNADPVPSGMKYIALYQDILGVYYAGGNLSDEALSIVKKGVEDDEGFEELYTPYWAYYDYYYQDLANIQMDDFLKCYIDTFLRNPVVMMRSILCRLDMMWDFRPGINAMETWQWNVENQGGNWTYLVQERNKNIFTKFINLYGEFSKQEPFKDIIWRVGFWNFFFFFLFFHCKKDGMLIIFLPLLGFLAAYIVSLGWSHYRYYWANEMLSFMGILYIVGTLAYGKSKSKMETV